MLGFASHADDRYGFAAPFLLVACRTFKGWAEIVGAPTVAVRNRVLYVNPEFQRALVDAARARLAELEAGFTIETTAIWPCCAKSRKTTVERMGFILQQGWAGLDFGEERELAQLRRLMDSLEGEAEELAKEIEELTVKRRREWRERASRNEDKEF